MLCDRCKQKEASVYYKTSRNGAVTEQALCQSCFAELQNTEYSDMLSSLFMPNGKYGTATRERKICTQCGARWEDIRRSSKAGCAKCYEIFREEFRTTVRSIHGDVTHVARQGMPQKAEQTKPSEEALLKEKLQEAVAREDYETAATLRDRIRALKREGAQ